MAAVTMLDLAKTSKPGLDSQVMYLTAKNSTLMTDTKIQVISQPDIKYTRFVDDIGSPDFSNVGVGFNSTSSRPEQLECTTYTFGMNVDVDRRLVADQSQVVDPRTSQLKANMIGYGAWLSGKLIEGDPATPGTDPNGNLATPFKGVRWYLDHADDPQGAKLDAGMKVDFGAVDLRGTVSTTNGRQFLKLFDQMVYRMWLAENGKGIVCYVPSEIFIGLPDIMRATATFAITQDSFGRVVYTYGNVKIVDAGLKTPSRSPLDNTTSAARVIGWEDTTGARSDTLAGLNSSTNGASTSSASRYSSMYFVQHGQDAFFAYSYGGQQTKDLGLLNDGVTYRTQVSDQLGLAFRTPWCVARAFNILIG